MSSSEIASDNEFENDSDILVDTLSDIDTDIDDVDDIGDVDDIFIQNDDEDSERDEEDEELNFDIDSVEENIKPKRKKIIYDDDSESDKEIQENTEPKIKAPKRTKKTQIIEKPKSLKKRAILDESEESLLSERKKVRVIDTRAKPRFEGKKKLSDRKIISAPSSNIKYDNKISVLKEDTTGQTVISDRTFKKKTEKITKLERYEVGIENMPYAFRELYKVLEKSMNYPLIRTSTFIYDCSYPDM